MKPVPNPIKIGYVSRKDIDISPNTHDYELTPHNEQTTTSPLPQKQKYIKTQINQSTPMKDFFHERIHPSQFVSPDNVRLNENNNTNINKQHPITDFNSNLSSQQYKEKQNHLLDIPTKLKWPTTKKVLVGIGATLLAATVITVPIVLGILLTRSSDTTTTTSTTTIASNVTTAYWTFDSITTDLYNVYNGVVMNAATYTAAGSTNQPFVGYGQALSLTSASSQYVEVTTPFLNLSSRSFTIEAWIYPTTISAVDRGIFGQCQCSTCSSQCLYLITRGTRLYISFTSNDLTGTTDLSANIWYHIAFVYNYQTQQQILYLNGVQDAIKSNAASYQGLSGSIRIGASQVYSNMAYFNGYIDNMRVTTRAKSSDEILIAGSLTFYYSFNLPNQTSDSGPNGLQGSLTSTNTMTGRVGEAVRFVGSGSYFQVYGIYNAPYGVSNTRTFSVSMWINPSVVTSSTFLQIFRGTLSTTSCTNLLGFYSSSGTVGQLFVWNVDYTFPKMMGPFITSNAWTHISLTLKASTGYTLYVNGSYFGSTGVGTYSTYSNFAYLFLGFYLTCGSNAVNVAYQGAIDEFYYHNRELTQADVTALYNV